MARQRTEAEILRDREEKLAWQYVQEQLKAQQKAAQEAKKQAEQLIKDQEKAYEAQQKQAREQLKKAEQLEAEYQTEYDRRHEELNKTKLGKIQSAAERGAEAGRERGGVVGAVIGGAAGGGEAALGIALGIAAQLLGRQLAAIAPTIAAPIVKALSPISLVNNALAQTGSGLGVFNKAVNLLGATLAPLLLPVFIVLAAAVVAASDYIWDKLLPSLGDWYSWIMGTAIPAIKSFSNGLIQCLADIIGWVNRNLLLGEDHRPKPYEGKSKEQMARDTREAMLLEINKPGGLDWAAKVYGPKVGAPPEHLAPPHPDALPESDVNKAKREADLKQWYIEQRMRLWEASQDKLGKEARAAGNVQGQLSPADKARQETAAGTAAQKPDSFQSALQDVTRSLRLSMGPKASYSGLTQVNQSAQLAALGGDPIDMKAMFRAIQSLEKIGAAIARNTEPRPVPHH